MIGYLECPGNGVTDHITKGLTYQLTNRVLKD